MTDVGCVYGRHAEVDGLVHTPRSHYSHQLVEEGVFLALRVIQTLSQLLRRLSRHFESKLSQLFDQICQLLFLWVGMPSQDRKRWVVFSKALSYSHVRKKHEFLDHEMGTDMLVFLDISWVLRI